ncbi:Bug family tripartite tricarboxylate transporter substrate binding protein [Pseudoroseomonas ludipueritiae]|uniref:Tripartite tricarboxylate transporter substrate binding protein n=1 Tax=Pseudoroseomonas ludipueritiae TaxID=198093 RepID=A0ABR7R5T8_9PROT|nr:tripartite tricarboxylate transporter substrate binding protein [Pseudoroseomonas ludipueritiae]MBC9177000.1 tripartite tricarboxylate transporter substrate binding protein [Pseudoroseomonas ludipueritiae]MCG7363945.1 tripartite tricarboxylate transporter substrate binding protein [Roseomonas sp. ACRSG]
MPISRRALALSSLVLTGEGARPGGAAAQETAPYPSRAVTWIVPFNAAGVTDSTSRLASRKLGQQLGQPVVIENRPGAGGTLGTEYAARAAPDGYTVLYGTNAAMSGAPALYRRLGYHPVRSFTPLQGLFESSNVLVANPLRPYRTAEEFIRFARANPGRVNLAHAGVGTSTHLTAVLFESIAGIEMTHVAYTGAAPALTDLMAGNVDVMFDYVATTRNPIAEGRMRPLAVTARARIPALPAVPTVAEVGLPDAWSSTWSGLFMPAGAPASVVERLSNAAAAVIRDPEMRAFGEGNGSRPMEELNGEAFARFVTAEMERWGEIVRRSGAQPL